MEATVSVSWPMAIAVCRAASTWSGPATSRVDQMEAHAACRAVTVKPLCAKDEGGSDSASSIHDSHWPRRSAGIKSRPERTSRRPSRTASLTASDHSTDESTHRGSAWVSAATGRRPVRLQSASSSDATPTIDGSHQGSIAGSPDAAIRPAAAARRAAAPGPRRPARRTVGGLRTDVAGTVGPPLEEAVGDRVQRPVGGEVDTCGCRPGRCRRPSACRRTTPRGRRGRAHRRSCEPSQGGSPRRTRRGRRGRLQSPDRAGRRPPDSSEGE